MIAVVPARADSRGLPGKNLRLFEGEPLVLRTCRKLTEAGCSRVVVATDDATAATVARLNGYEVVKRDHVDPHQTIAQMVHEVVTKLEYKGAVGVFQCTCPLVKVSTYERILEESAHSALVTITRPDHLLWSLDGKSLGTRNNRQDPNTPGAYAETGVAKLANFLEGEDTLADPFADSPRLFYVDQEEALDIDDSGDWARAVNNLHKQQTIRWYVGNKPSQGSGHVRRFLTLYRSLPNFQHEVMLDVWSGKLADEIAEVAPDARIGALTPNPSLIVWDRLNVPYMPARRYLESAVPQIALESEGQGMGFVQSTVNEFSDAGRPFATVRPEFHAVPPKDSSMPIENVLVTFGGTDPEGFTEHAFRALKREPYAKHFTIPGNPGRPMAELMAEADVVVTSGGRTVFEAMVAGRPVVSLAVNGREREHIHGEGPLKVDYANQLPEAIQRVYGEARDRVDAAHLSCDGLGAGRLADMICAMAAAERRNRGTV